MRRYKTAICFYGNLTSLQAEKLVELSQLADVEIFACGVVEKVEYGLMDLLEKTIENATMILKGTGTEVAKGYRMGDIVKYGLSTDQIMVHPHADITSSLMSVLLAKKERELSTNLRFDLVVVAQFDTDYDRIKTLIAGHHNLLDLHGTVKCKRFKNHFDNGLWAIDPSLMMGLSKDMDTVGRFHSYYRDGNFWKMTGTSDLDPGLKMATLGSLLHIWLSMRQLAVIDL